MKSRLTAILAGAALSVALVLPASAALTYEFDGGGAIADGAGNPGNAAILPSDSVSAFGNVELESFPTDPAAITELSFDYNANVTGASGGSPRLTVGFSDGGSADLRPLALVADTWVTIDGPTGTWDNNGGTCGYVYNTAWATVLGCHVGAAITSMTVINDSGWAFAPDGTQVLVDNIVVNSDVITFDEVAGLPEAVSKDDCKKGGWQDVAREDGSLFKNQGDCVSYTNNGK